MGEGGGVVLWDAATHRRLAGDPLFTGQQGAITDVAFSPDGKTIAAGYGDRYIKGGGVLLWDVATRRRLADDPLPVKESYVSGVAFSRDGRTIVSGSWDGAVRLRDAVGGQERRVLWWHVGSAGSVSYSPDGRTLASGGSEGTVRLFGRGGRCRATRDAGTRGRGVVGVVQSRRPESRLGGL